MNIPTNILALVFVLSVLIVVHEGGHFAVAKLVRFPVEVFSVGFGKRLLKEGLSATLMGLMLFQLAYPWGVGVSRFRDNRHNASDIIAGFIDELEAMS